MNARFISSIFLIHISPADNQRKSWVPRPGAAPRP